MKQGLGIREQGLGLVLLPKPVRRVDAAQVVREATTGRVVSTVPAVVARPKPMLLPKVWAVAEAEGAGAAEIPEAGLEVTGLLLIRTRDMPSCDGVDLAHEDAEGVDTTPDSSPDEPPSSYGGTDATYEDGALVSEAPEAEAEAPAELAFYRKYTEAMLRRYVRLSMATGRVPSLLGRELFRGHVSSYRMTNFEDVVVFCFDMEKLLGRLGTTHQQLIKRIAMQQHTQGEVASTLRIPFRSCKRMYGRALDAMTEMLLEVRMLEPLKSCQGGSSQRNDVFDSF